jgi:protein-tyrosine phosphatase
VPVQKVLFVCMGNICRSPTAEGVFQQLVARQGLEQRFEIDSAGTGDWHVGAPPDQRAQQAANLRNIDLSSLRARQVSVDDFTYFDTIIAMDHDNLNQLQRLAPENQRHKIRLLLEYQDGPTNREVPDPYYGGENGFEEVLDLIEAGCENLLGKLLNR